MAQPVITLPKYIDRNLVDGAGSYYVEKQQTRQSRPYNLPTAYVRSGVFTTKASLNGTSFGGQANASANSNWPKPGPGFLDFVELRERDWAINSARDKFVSAVREEAMLAVNYAERKQAISMISSRAEQLLRFTRAVKRGRIGDAAAALRLSPDEAPKRARWRRSRSVSNTFLEFHFGWEPIVKDIWTAANLLSQPVYWPRVNVVGKRHSWNTQVKVGTVGPTNNYTIQVSAGSVRASVGAELYVSDPNIWLLNQLGLLNPFSVGWELIPWSFLWDWVFNMSDWLNQWTDFAGLTLQNSWHSVKVRNPTYSYYRQEYWRYARTAQAEMQGEWFQRKLGIPAVTLGRLPYKPLSAVRGATAMSLLAGQLPHREASPRVGERQFKNIAHPAWYGKYLR